MSRRSNRRSKSKRAQALLSLKAELMLLLDDPKSIQLMHPLMAGELRHAIKFIHEKGRLPHYLIPDPFEAQMQIAAEQLQREIDRKFLEDLKGANA